MRLRKRLLCNQHREEKLYKDPKLHLKFIILSAIGIFVFFIPIKVNGSSTIPLEYVISLFINNLPKVATAYAFIIIMIGAFRPFVKGTWKADKVTMIFSFTKLIGAFFTLYLFSGYAPEAVARDDQTYNENSLENSRQNCCNRSCSFYGVNCCWCNDD